LIDEQTGKPQFGVDIELMRVYTERQQAEAAIELDKHTLNGIYLASWTKPQVKTDRLL
jgi:hypothetical protein